MLPSHRIVEKASSESPWINRKKNATNITDYFSDAAIKQENVL